MRKLNERQQEAVNSIKGQILVISCPGSGKTTVIIERCKQMVDSGIRPSSMLNITFTKSAADEMEKRYSETYGNEGVSFSTIHSYCYTVLRKEYGYSRDDILKESEKWTYVSKMLYRKVAPGEMDETTKNVFNEISYVKNQELPVSLFYPESCEKSLFEQIFNGYEEYKRQEKKLDFDDMIIKCRDLFRSHPGVLQKWQETCQYITIDEYQDVNKIQAEIFYLLTGKNGNLFVVGDDDQSIYRFRAADSSIMLNFPKRFPECHTICMGTNYRSCKDIVSISDRLIRNNQQRFNKDFIAFRKDPGAIFLQKYKNTGIQTKKVCEEIFKLHHNGIAYEEIAILYRVNSLNLPIITEMMQMNMPFYTTEQPKSIHNDAIFLDIMAYYRLSKGIVNKGDLQRILNKPSRFLKADYFRDCIFDKKELLNACNVIPDQRNRENTKSRIIDLIFDIEALKNLSPVDLITQICKMGYKEWLKDYAAFRGKTPEEIYTVLDALLSEAAEYDTMEDYLLYVKQYEARLQEIRKSKSKKGVCLSSFHAAKGLEWKCVFVINVNEDVTPFIKAQTMSELEEERRMFYVAITRAKDMLYLSYLTGERNEIPASPYLREMDLIRDDTALTVNENPNRKLDSRYGLGSGK